MDTIGTKTCTRCGESKSVEDFQKNRATKDGLMGWCKECYSKWAAEYYKKNKDKIKLRHKEYYESDRGKELARKRSRTEKAKESRRKYAKAHKEQIDKRYKEYYEKNREKIKIRKRKYQQKNKDKVSKWHKNYRERHKEQIAAKQKEYVEKNKEKIRARINARRQHDDLYRVKEQTRNMVRYAFRSKGHKKTSRTKDIIGCDLNFFFEYLKQTWENRYGKPWSGEAFHIDHITPLATAKTKEDIMKLCHYTNLQMLTPEDNMDKRDSLEWDGRKNG